MRYDIALSIPRYPYDSDPGDDPVYHDFSFCVEAEGVGKAIQEAKQELVDLHLVGEGTWGETVVEEYDIAWGEITQEQADELYRRAFDDEAREADGLVPCGLRPHWIVQALGEEGYYPPEDVIEQVEAGDIGEGPYAEKAVRMLERNREKLDERPDPQGLQSLAR